MDLAATISQEQGCCVVHISGEIDIDTAAAFKRILAEQITAGQHRLVLDLSRVDFIDSTGLGVIVGAVRRLRAVQGRVCVAGATDRVATIFQVTHLVRVFTLHPSVAAACADACATPQPAR